MGWLLKLLGLSLGNKEMAISCNFKRQADHILFDHLLHIMLYCMHYDVQDVSCLEEGYVAMC